METHISGYGISEILIHLTLDNLDCWYRVANFWRKMISVKTRYKTYNNELLAIIKAFKT